MGYLKKGFWLRWEKSGLERVGESGGFGTKFWWRGKKVAERLTVVEKGGR